ncbi:hypothetical protein B0H19DRAFT_903728, partial [Mycena capillaripes]
EAEAQFIARAVAAQYENNKCRLAFGLPNLAEKVFACKIMTGSALTFYKIPVSDTLLESVEIAQYPTQAIIASKFVPPVRDPSTHLARGMVPLDNRRIFFRC